MNANFFYFGRNSPYYSYYTPPLPSTSTFSHPHIHILHRFFIQIIRVIRRGPVQCGQHFQLIEIGLHIFGESALGAIASVLVTYGYGYHQVLLLVRPRAVCVQQRFESAPMVKYIT